MCGKREDGWGKEKVFREGQKKQTLDDLFFVFLDIVAKLRPKVVVAENVVGIIRGNAKGYCNLIVKRFRELGYDLQVFVLNSAFMNVPQRRERVFFIANNQGYGRLKLKFNEKPVTFGEIKSREPGKMPKEDSNTAKLLSMIRPGDKTLADVFDRLGNRHKYFNQTVLFDKEVPPTLVAGVIPLRAAEKGYCSLEDLRNMQTFPQDYDFINNTANNAGYVCGMSVPPNMMAHIAEQIWLQWLKKTKE